MSVNVAAVDLGASSGRVVLGRVGRDSLRVEAVARFDNDPLRLPDGLHWNIGELYHQALLGLRAAARSVGVDGLESVGVDSWAVDYGLLRGDRLLGLPFHYRDERSAAGVEAVHAVMSAEELHGRNGLQFLPFNTLYQLAVDPLAPLADTLLTIPDLMTYWLSERVGAELTNASTTGLLDVRTRDWDRELCTRLGIQPQILPELVVPGTRVGEVTPIVADHVGVRRLTVTAVGSHDTASAVVGVPMTADDAAYISCGTWGLVGVELDEPVLSAESRGANFTNEGGVDGRVRFLTNVMGTWLLSETIRSWERDGTSANLTSLLREANDYDGPVTIFDVQDPRFLPPGDMPRRITSYCADHDLPAPGSRAALVRSIVESLAEGFTQALRSAATLSGRSVGVVHVVGGGAQNTLLCQSLADRCGLPVVAGPVEATAIGNVLVQARAAGALTGDLAVMRDLISSTQELTTHTPRPRR